MLCFNAKQANEMFCCKLSCFGICQVVVLWNLSSCRALESVKLSCFGICQVVVLWNLSSCRTLESVKLLCCRIYDAFWYTGFTGRVISTQFV